MAGLFALPHSIIYGSPEDFVNEIANDGFTSLNLCLKYHASRNLFVRHGMSMMHLEDGAHYYETNSHFYTEKEVAPETNTAHISQQKMEGKFDGKITDAASQAVEQNLFKVTKSIKK